MSIQSVQGQFGAFAREVEGTDAAQNAQPTSVRAPALEKNSTSRYGEAAHTISSVYGAGLTAAQLLAQSNGKTSKEQAAVFDFCAVLAKIFESAADFFAGKNAQAPAAGGTPSAPGVEAKAAHTPERGPATPAGKPAGNSNAKKEAFVAPDVPANGDHVRTGVEEKVSAEGETTINGTKFKGKAEARALAEAKASSGTFAGPDGVGAVAEASARLAVEASAEGSIESDYGKVSGRAHCAAELYARAKAYAVANAKGAHAGAEIEVGARATADAQIDASTLGGNVTVHGEGRADAGTGAKAQARADISYDPLQAAVDAKVGAFAGARAGFKANGGVAGVKYGVSGEVRAGVGIDAEVNAGISDGKLKFSFGFGVSVGVGFALKFDFEIDLKGVGKAFGDLFGAIAEMFGGNKGDWSHAANTITQVIGQMPAVQDQLNKTNKQFDSGSSSDFESTSRKSGGGEIDLSGGSNASQPMADVTPSSTPDVATA